jgi:hypothetical protein
MLLNILFVLAIIWLTFAIASILVGMYYTYTVVLPYLIDWDSSEELPYPDSCTGYDSNCCPEHAIEIKEYKAELTDDDLPF